MDSGVCYFQLFITEDEEAGPGDILSRRSEVGGLGDLRR